MIGSVSIFSIPSLIRSVGLALLVAFAYGPADVHAQWASLRGRVTDLNDGEPLPGVHVAVKGPRASTGTITNRDGYYILSRIRPGESGVESSLVICTGLNNHFIPHSGAFGSHVLSKLGSS